MKPLELYQGMVYTDAESSTKMTLIRVTKGEDTMYYQEDLQNMSYKTSHK